MTYNPVTLSLKLSYSNYYRFQEDRKEWSKKLRYKEEDIIEFFCGKIYNFVDYI